jgi:hypothetical protein
MDQNGPYVSICLLVNSLDPLISTGEFRIFQVAWSLFLINRYINIYFCLLRTGVYSWEQQLILHVWPRFPTFPPPAPGSPCSSTACWPRSGRSTTWTAFGRFGRRAKVKVRGKGGMAWNRRMWECHLGAPTPHGFILICMICTLCQCVFCNPSKIYWYIQVALHSETKPEYGDGVEPPDWWLVMFPRWWSNPGGPWRKDAIVNDKSDGCWTLFDMWYMCMYVPG